MSSRRTGGSSIGRRTPSPRRSSRRRRAPARRSSSAGSRSLVTEDPDFEIVRYRYRWTSGGRLVRQVGPPRALGRDPERRDPAGRDAHLRRDAVRREASRADGLGLRDAAGLENGARPRPGPPVRGRSTTFPVLVGAVLVAGETGVPVLRLRGLGLGRGAFAAGFAAGEEPPATAIVAQIAASRITPASATSSERRVFGASSMGLLPSGAHR